MTIRTALKAAVTIAAFFVIACIAVLAWMKFAPRHVPESQRPLETLDATSLPALRNAFNAAIGDVRVLVLLSPT